MADCSTATAMRLSYAGDLIKSTGPCRQRITIRQVMMLNHPPRKLMKLLNSYASHSLPSLTYILKKKKKAMVDFFSYENAKTVWIGTPEDQQEAS